MHPKKSKGKPKGAGSWLRSQQTVCENHRRQDERKFHLQFDSSSVISTLPSFGYQKRRPPWLPGIFRGAKRDRSRGAGCAGKEALDDGYPM